MTDDPDVDEFLDTIKDLAAKRIRHKSKSDKAVPDRHLD